MARTLTVDGVQLLRVQFAKDPATGAVQAYAEYALRAGGQVVQTVHRELTTQLSATRRLAIGALVDQLGQDLAAIEQL